MFIEASRSAWRTRAGCNVGYALVLRELIPVHCTLLGCGSRTGPRFYKHCTPPRVTHRLKPVLLSLRDAAVEFPAALCDRRRSLWPRAACSRM